MPIIINIHGPMAAGKSTLTSLLRDALSEYAYVDRPNIKRGLKPMGRDSARKLSKEASYHIVEQLIEQERDVITEELNPDSLKKKFGEALKRHNYKLISFYIKCSLDAALKRDEARSKKTRPENVRMIHAETPSPRDYEVVIDTENMSIDDSIKYMLDYIKLS